MAPPKYRYSVSAASNPNDPAKLAAEIAKIDMSDPTSFGGVVKDPDKNPTDFPQFTASFPPDVNRDTHIVAICGLTTLEANPSKHGWFLSDFLAFYHILRNINNNQTWIHSLKLDKLVKDHGVYLHGNPYKSRKVVLDKDILAVITADSAVKHVVHSHNLVTKFQQAITKARDLAAQADASLLILVFAHGILSASGPRIVFGTDSFFRISDMKALLAQAPKVKVTMLSTSCFSGGWAISPELNMTMLAAAGELTQSRSWRFSASMKRASGSPFATWILDSIMNETVSEEQLAHASGLQMEAYSAHTAAMYKDVLNKIDQRAYQHGFSFSAQEDAWESNWAVRQGLPLADYLSSWNQLKNHGPDQTLHPGDPYNRDPNVSEGLKEEFQRLLRESQSSSEATDEATGVTALPDHNEWISSKFRKVSPIGDSMQSFRDQVLNAADFYKASCPGILFEDHAQSSLVQKMERIRWANREELQETWDELRYRCIELPSLAKKYLGMMDVAHAKGIAFEEFRSEEFRDLHLHDKRLNDILRNLFRQELFPLPPRSLGWAPFYKPQDFVAAALYYSQLSLAEIESKIALIKAEIERPLKEIHDELVQDSGISRKRSDPS
ncbi:hypothetical protein FH972_024900 [Carpinus fangiana]|uniref:Uncharacterized protein n=1 Tax=Carpinus fangiana TaxID=176857 RepID=A0A5N6KZG5_9ROSI|nr:hypothetical protein FH972_024900 [Carpinus fangiana]